jgi:peroxiredoxin Q/BCP
VSLDTAEKNAEFAESMGAELPVVSDPDGAVAKRFGVLGFAGLYSNRWTFYVDAEGLLRAIDQQVEPATAGEDIVSKLRELGFPARKAPGDSAD